MENMIYQCRVDVQILTDSDKYQHLAGYSVLPDLPGGDL